MWVLQVRDYSHLCYTRYFILSKFWHRKRYLQDLISVEVCNIKYFSQQCLILKFIFPKKCQTIMSVWYLRCFRKNKYPTDVGVSQRHVIVKFLWKKQFEKIWIIQKNSKENTSSRRVSRRYFFFVSKIFSNWIKGACKYYISTLGVGGGSEGNAYFAYVVRGGGGSRGKMPILLM